ncbi:unnamed protein product, partial [Mesorhabditis belari]|uniref:Uncharacterized protein n=1 Tax=Mesorhabditis belari TaxID=2138241 RepID=A0AAF3ETL0_9BILA
MNFILPNSTHGAYIRPSYLEEYFDKMKIVETVNLFIMIPSLLIYYYLFTAQRICHPNLTTLMLSQPIGMTISTII